MFKYILFITILLSSVIGLAMGGPRIALFSDKKLLLDENGHLWVEQEYSQFEPIDINDNMPPILEITSTNSALFLLDSDGGVWKNVEKYSLKVKKIEMRDEKGEEVIVKAITLKSDSVFLLDTNGEVWAFSDDLYSSEPKRIVVDEDNVKFQAISPGLKHTLLLDTDGEVWALELPGYTPKRIIIDGENVKFQAISTGESHDLLLDTDGKVWGFDFLSEHPPKRVTISYIDTVRIKTINKSYLLDDDGYAWISRDARPGDIWECVKPGRILEMCNCDEGWFFVTDEGKLYISRRGSKMGSEQELPPDLLLYKRISRIKKANATANNDEITPQIDGVPSELGTTLSSWATNAIRFLSGFFPSSSQE